MEYIILGILVYVFIVWRNIVWVRKAHGIGGKWGNLSPDGSDVFWCYFPFWNLITFITNLFISPYKNRKKVNLAKFLIGKTNK